MNPFNRLIPRLNGTEIEDHFDYYLDLTRKGVAGFIVFGGEVETVREGLRSLRDASAHPLIIASDLEQGLGQQLSGGTLFPPAMAIASACKKVDRSDVQRLLDRLYGIFAIESRYAGINTILAPVLDINTNPRNPIISTRAFGEDPRTVSELGCEMIKVLQRNSIRACGKHFPGHGDTEIDSHRGLPVIGKDLSALEGREFIPFKRAIDTGVAMIMLGHLSVPSLDPSGRPASISEKAVNYLRRQMGFGGLLITDAMNMGGLGNVQEDEACLMALRAGVDIILHPTDPHRTASYINHNRLAKESLRIDAPAYNHQAIPDFAEHRTFSDKLSTLSIVREGEARIEKPFAVILNDGKREKEPAFAAYLKQRFSHMGHVTLSPEEDIPWQSIPADRDLIACVFSSVRAWKKDTTTWLLRRIRDLAHRADVFISFGNPYVLKDVEHVPKIFAFWDSEGVQRAVAENL